MSEKIKLGSNRGFGIVFFVVFALIGVYPLINNGELIIKKDFIQIEFDTPSKGKICFVQSIPTERSPKKLKIDEARLFVTFRKEEKIKNEISVTSGYIYKSDSIVAKSGKNKFSFNQSQGRFGWIKDEEEEFNLIKVMKKATKLSISASTANGVKTKEMYSMMGFTKAYNTAKKSCA